MNKKKSNHTPIFSDFWRGSIRGGGEGRSDVTRWALISDTHIHADPAAVSPQGVTMAENLRKVVNEILQEKDSLTGVIVNGDCAYDRGTPEQYRTFTGLMEPLREAGLPLHFNTGNHDNREVLAEVLGDSASGQIVEGRRCTVVETPLVNLLLLDSLYPSKEFRVEGEIGKAQLTWLDSYLIETSKKPTIVIVHHHPMWPPSKGGLVDTSEFLDLIDRHTNVKAYIYGHSHRWQQIRRESGVQEVNLPTTAYVVESEQPAAWVLVDISSNGMTLDLHTIDHDHPWQGQRCEYVWR